MSFHLVPYPTGIVRQAGGQCFLDKTITVEEGDFTNWCVTAFLKRTHLSKGSGTTKLQLHRDSTLSSEAYKLEIKPASVAVTAASERGIIWGLTTAANLLKDQALPCCVIEDAPIYPHRGIHLDCARHFFPLKTVKRIVEGMSLAKLNVLHWHLSDDQGWRIESKRFPLLNETSGQYYTQAEIGELVEFARLRSVEIIPEIDMPGHTTGLLAAYPQYSCSGKKVTLATSGGIYPTILCPGKDETMAFVGELLAEIVPLFPGPRFHIGGDEAPKGEWSKCPHCRQRMQREGLTTPSQLQGWFTEQVAKMLTGYGKQSICWNETLLAEPAPEGLHIQYWTLQYRDSMEHFVKNGGKWIYSDMFELYFDYPYSMTSLKKVYHTAPHLGKTEYDKGDGLLGLECCLWTEHITEAAALEQMLFPRAYAVAELCWCGKREYGDFISRLQGVSTALPGKAIQFAPAGQWDPKGSARRKEALAYFTKMNSAMSADVREQTVSSAAPNKEFAGSFMKKFFQPSDLPFLLFSMMKGDK